MSVPGEPAPKAPWHQSPPFLITALLVLGPLAIPLIWSNKRLPLAAKAGLTVVMVALTLWLIKATAQMAAQLTAQMTELRSMMNSGGTGQ